MTISQAISEYLLAQSALTNVIGDRLYPERADENTPKPYVAYHVELRESEPKLTLPIAMFDVIFEFVIISTAYDEAFQIADLLIAALAYVKATMSGLRVESIWLEDIIGGYTPELDLYGTTARFGLQYIPQ